MAIPYMTADKIMAIDDPSSIPKLKKYRNIIVNPVAVSANLKRKGVFAFIIYDFKNFLISSE